MSLRGPRFPPRRPFRDLTVAEVEQMGRDLFARDEARWNACQEEFDARRDELQEHEINELMGDHE